MACSKSASRSRQSSMPTEIRTRPSPMPRLLQFLLRHAGMRGGLGMAGQRLDAAERHRVARDPQIAQERERGVAAAVEIERENAARIIALRLADANLLGIVEQRGIEHAPDLRTAVPALRRCAARSCSAGSCAARPWAGGRRASSIRRAAECCRTCCGGCGSCWINCGIAGDRDARHHVAEAGKILGGRVEHQVGAQRQRMLERRARETCCPP